MHIPIKVDYGVRALLDLAEHAQEPAVRSADISLRQHIPQSFLDRLLLTLAKDGLVRSVRGPLGGHALARDPAQVTLGMVMRSLGGNETIVGCLEAPESCNHLAGCGQREIWSEVEDAVQRILDGTSIADLLVRTKAARALVVSAAN
ncbi:MAG: Rrf2 family transcriptional regulator [Dehalococcoidia bacterium]|nr:Rrf2 family transcriptional regulator [Dehalococcoidia bacterium]